MQTSVSVPQKYRLVVEPSYVRTYVTHRTLIRYQRNCLHKVCQGTFFVATYIHTYVQWFKQPRCHCEELLPRIYAVQNNFVLSTLCTTGVLCFLSCICHSGANLSQHLWNALWVRSADSAQTFCGHLWKVDFHKIRQICRNNL